MTSPNATRETSGWYGLEEADLGEFRTIVEQELSLDDYPFAEAEQQNVLVYGAGLLQTAQATPEDRRRVQSELARALLDGPGIAVFKGVFTDSAVIERATEVFFAMIDEQRRSGASAGDHFAEAGVNDRVWRALDKLALRDPELFVDYYKSAALALVCEAWLGPSYQVTSQINVVNPGGKAQTAHRDYHLGFMSLAEATGYPAHVHLLSPALTLQGAVAHCDMPVETGPTLYLPFSQKYPAGYVAFHRQDFIDYFDAHHVQLPLEKGDAVFFNPAVFHGAGSNRTSDVKRMANLLQISSAFGRAMEAVDRTAIIKALFPMLVRRRAAGEEAALLRNVVAAAAEGYAFPTDLDQDQPVGGMTPRTQAQLVWTALQDGWPAAQLEGALSDQAARRHLAQT